MNEERVRQWLLLAEGDLKTAKDEMSSQEPFTNTVCFHCQQCVEKYLKAYLTFVGKPIRRTHDLTELITQCSETDSDFRTLFEIDVDRLTQYAIDIRYPDEFYFPDRREAEEAITLAERAKSFVLERLKKKGFSKEAGGE